MSSYSRRQAIALVAGLAASAALDARAKDSNMQRKAVMDIDIKRNGSRPSTKGNSDWFTGSVRVDPLFQAPDPGRVSGGQVTFEPGARTAWHTHPLGQTLVVTAGLGWVTHIAIQESLDGKNVDWMEKVADDQYRK
jgi:hypothetical protein